MVLVYLVGNIKFHGAQKSLLFLSEIFYRDYFVDLSSGVLLLWKLVLLKFRSQEKQSDLSAVKLAVFDKLSKKCPQYRHGKLNAL